MSTVDHTILTPDTLSALAMLAQNMVNDCKAVSAVKTSNDLIPALSNVAERGHEAGGVAIGDIVRKVLAGASKADILGFMNQDSGTKGGKAIAAHVMRGLRALAAKDSPSGKAVGAWLNDETLKYDAASKAFHFAPKTQRETLKARLIAILGEGTDDELLARVDGLNSKVSAAMKAATASERKAEALAEELAKAKAALKAASKPAKPASKPARVA